MSPRHSPYRRGLVVAQDLVGWRVRVQFQDFDGVTSYWLGVGARKTQSDKDWWMPDIGEQVACLFDPHDEDGVVVCAIGSTVDTPPSGATKDQRIVNFFDGASFKYDRAAHALTIALPSGATANITCSGATIAIDASGNVQVNGETIKLAGGGPNIALVGGQTICPAGTGTIVAEGNSTKVSSS